MNSIVCTVVLATALASSAGAQDSFWAVESGNTLYSVDVATLTATPVGPVGFSSIGGLSTTSDGTLWGITSSSDDLIVIDPATGAGTLAVSIGVGFNFSMGMAIDPASDRFYAAGPGSGYSSQLFEIDPTTGGTTVIVDTTVGCFVGLDFDALGNLWGIEGCTPDEFLGIDLTTGTLTIPTADGLGSWRGIGCFAIGKSGSMYAIHNDMRLLRIEPTTGLATDLGVLNGLAGGVVTGLTSKSPAKQLLGTPSQISLSTGGSQVLQMGVGASEAGKNYQVLGAASGTAPGFVYSGTLIPLNPDPYTIYTLLNPNTPILNGSGGVLNSSGQATAVFTLPPATDPGLAGLTVNHAGVVLELIGPNIVVTLATNAEACLLVP